MSFSSVAEQAVAEKVEALERQVANLQAELARTRAMSLGGMLGPLRLRQIVLLYVGKENASQLVETLSQDFKPSEVNQAIRHLWLLNNAPCTDEQREQFRAMFNNGMSKF